jgi:hypothetical protein
MPADATGRATERLGSAFTLSAIAIVQNYTAIFVGSTGVPSTLIRLLEH